MDSSSVDDDNFTGDYYAIIYGRVNRVTSYRFFDRLQAHFRRTDSIDILSKRLLAVKCNKSVETDCNLYFGVLKISKQTGDSKFGNASESSPRKTANAAARIVYQYKTNPVNVSIKQTN